MALQPVQSVRIQEGTASPPASVVTAADFTYLGHYDVPPQSGVLPSPNQLQGLTVRRVAGAACLLTLQGSFLKELPLAGKVFGDRLTVSRTWASIGGFSVSGDFKGIWWDEAGQRLWTTAARAYTTIVQPTQIYTRELRDDLTVANLRGPFTLAGTHDRRVFGGACAIPPWFQQQYHVGPYAVGWGGGTSLILQGGGASIGPVLYAMPDPDTLTPGVSTPCTTILDTAPANQHRGVRATLPINYLDGGQTGNPSTPPSGPPLPGATWQSPRADGKGWWTPCDAYWNTGNWIDGTKRGFVAVLSGFGGKAYYMASDVHCDALQFELHVYDPSDLGAAAAGAVPPFSVEPTTVAAITLPGLSNQGHKTHMTPGKGVGGAAYDSMDRRLYLLGLGINNFSTTSRVYVFQVAA